MTSPTRQALTEAIHWALVCCECRADTQRLAESIVRKLDEHFLAEAEGAKKTSGHYGGNGRPHTYWHGTPCDCSWGADHGNGTGDAPDFAAPARLDAIAAAESRVAELEAEVARLHDTYGTVTGNAVENAAKDMRELAKLAAIAAHGGHVKVCAERIGSLSLTAPPAPAAEKTKDAYTRGFEDGEQQGVSGARRQIAAWLHWAWSEPHIADKVNAHDWGDEFGNGPLPKITAAQAERRPDGSSVVWVDVPNSPPARVER